MVPNRKEPCYPCFMARPREFDTDDALSKAMDVFWEHGYSDATLPDLLAGMNLTRGSLYKAFTDKKTLFLRVLDTYDEQAVSAAVNLLNDENEDGWVKIFQLFQSIVDAVKAGDHRGCLLCSAMAGPASYDAEIEAYASQSLDRMRIAFERALAPVVQPNKVAPLANMLVTQYVGMRVLARTKGSQRKIEQSLIALRSIAGQFNP